MTFICPSVKAVMVHKMFLCPEMPLVQQCQTLHIYIFEDAPNSFLDNVPASSFNVHIPTLCVQSLVELLWIITVV